MTGNRRCTRARSYAALAAVAAASLLAACASAPTTGSDGPAGPAQVANARIGGTILHRDRKALPDDAEVDVWLGVPGAATRIGETTIRTQGRQVPIPFMLEVDLAKVEPGKAYPLHIAIRYGGQVQYVTGARVSIVPAEPPTGLSVLVVPGREEAVYSEAEAPRGAGPTRRGPGPGRSSQPPRR